MSPLDTLIQPDTLALLIPIVAIITGGVIVVVRMILRHQERMAMIDHGLHPDHPPEDEEMIR